MQKTVKIVVGAVSALAFALTGVAACAGPAHSAEPNHAPEGMEVYDLPGDQPDVVTFCSHGIRLFVSSAVGSSDPRPTITTDANAGTC
jgi:hypothetical protein